MLERTGLEEALATAGELLARRGHAFELYVVGGGALNLLGLIARPTRDIDVAGLVRDEDVVKVERLPGPLREAIEDAARIHGLKGDWLNVGPRALLDFGLPDGALARATVRRWQGLTLHLAHREDQIAFKLYAAVDQGPHSRHYADLVELRPTRDELIAAARWARTHDTSEAFRSELVAALKDLGVRDAVV